MIIAKLGWVTGGSFRCECDQRVKTIEQHDNTIVFHLEQSIGEAAFRVGIPTRIMDYLSRQALRDGMEYGAKSTQVNKRKLRVLEVLESGRTALKYQ